MTWLLRGRCGGRRCGGGSCHRARRRLGRRRGHAPFRTVIVLSNGLGAVGRHRAASHGHGGRGRGLGLYRPGQGDGCGEECGGKSADGGHDMELQCEQGCHRASVALGAQWASTYKVVVPGRSVLAGRRLGGWASGGQSDLMSLTWPREASKRQAQEGNRYGYGRCSNAVPAWHASMWRFKDRYGQCTDAHQANHRVGLNVVRRSLQRRYRDAGLVAEVRAIRLVRRAVRRLRPIVMHSRFFGPVRRRQPGVIRRRRRQARVGDPSTQGKNPRQQHACCPTAELLTVAEHDRCDCVSSRGRDSGLEEQFPCQSPRAD